MVQVINLTNLAIPAAPPSYRLPNVAITAIAAGANPRITTASAHGLSTSDFVTIENVQGATECNGDWAVLARVNATVFTITLAAHSTYTGGGDICPGLAIPTNLKSWDLAVDLGGTIPSGQTFSLTVEYQRSAWTDAAGGQHPAGEWLPDAGADMTTGTYTPKSGVPTSVNHVSSSIGAVNQGGGMVEPYPLRARFRVDSAGAWTLPSVVLSLT